MLDALSTAHNIWKEAQDLSPETWKVYRVLSQLFDGLDIGERDAVYCLRATETTLPIDHSR